MKPDETWILLETEPSGMKRPLYAVEIAAQRMRGYTPDGLPFRVLLNHGVPLEPHTVAIHGYTEDYLRLHGQEPRTAHTLFRDYAGSRPVVSHNLPMDWDRLLVPECQRLGFPVPGTRGFCALALARRALPEASSFSLSALNQRYQLVTRDLRGAVPDVEALVRLFQHWMGPRLTAAGIVGFQAVSEFSRQTPPAKCRARIEAAVKDQMLPVPTTPASPPPTPASVLEEFNQLVRGVMADGVMTTAEFLIIIDWLRDCPHPEVHPIDRLQAAAERITARGGEVTVEDQQRLEGALRYYLQTGQAPPPPLEPQPGTAPAASAGSRSGIDP